MSLEGELAVRLDWNGTHVAQAHIRSTRRAQVARLVCGRTPAEALAWLPRVFSLCTAAQALAAQLALSHAGAQVTDVKSRADVEREIIDEYLFRLLIDWPDAAGEPFDARTLAEARRLPRESLPGFAAEHLYGEAPSRWLSRHGVSELDAWTASGATLPARLLGRLLRETPWLGRSDVMLMPDATPAAIEQHVIAAMARDTGFARAPTWDGVPVETGALARVKSHPLVAAVVARDANTAAARMVARLAELALLLEAREPVRANGFTTRADAGIGVVQTARGLLVHRVRVAGDHIAEYDIVAPTEWNFHPQGALHQGLRGLAARNEREAERRATLAVQALDPCVACAIEVARA